MDAFKEILDVERHMRATEDDMAVMEGVALERAINSYTHLTAEFEAMSGYDIEEKFSKICTGLQFDARFLDRPFNLLSGGEQTNVILGKILLDKPDILLLDEPTNHLDIDAIETLEEALEDFQGTMLFISHDRYFINKVKPLIVAVEGQKLVKYLGDYDYYKSVLEKM